jgi:hypothetical protein
VVTQREFDRTLPFNEPTPWFNLTEDHSPLSLPELRAKLRDGHHRWIAALRHLHAFLEAESNPDQVDRTIVVLPVVHATRNRGHVMVNQTTRGAAWYLPRIAAMITRHEQLEPVLDHLDTLTDPELLDWWRTPTYWKQLGRPISETRREVDDQLGRDVFTVAGIDTQAALGWLDGPSTLVADIAYPPTP